MKKRLMTHTFRGEIKEVSLRSSAPLDPKSLKDADLSDLNPRMAILVVGVRYHTVSTCTAKATSDLTLPDERRLSLADAQNLIDWSRRIFPRWNSKAGTGETFFGDMIARLRILDHADKGRWQEVDQTFQKAPWLKCLMRPFTLDRDAQLFGDERSFVTSAIWLDKQDGVSDERAALGAISQDDLFRLAEADSAGDGPPYQRPFVEAKLKEYMYTRHAPAPSPGGWSGNSTYILVAHHHLCLISYGWYAEHCLFNHVETYYRHLQFLSVYEYFRLVHFSQRLTRLVKRRAEDPEFEFAERLRDLRQDFLNFTHLHHFSNVRHQLQPREMFHQLYQAMELADRFKEVEDELRVASEFQAARHASEAADRAENLNDLIAYSVPLTLMAGLTGANLFIGANHPDYQGEGGENAVSPVLGFVTQLQHSAWIVFLVGVVWGLACWMIAARIGRENPGGMRKEKTKYKRQAGFWVCVGVLALGLGYLPDAISWLEMLQ